MSTITVKNGTQIYCTDWGSGQPVVFQPRLAADGGRLRGQMLFPAARRLPHDRRGHGRSSRP